MGYTSPIIFFPILTIYFLQSKHDHRKIIYMNLKTTNMSEYKFYFGSDAVDYYVNFQDINGWASTAFEIYKYVADECDYDGKIGMRAAYLDLLTQVEDRIREIWD